MVVNESPHAGLGDLEQFANFSNPSSKVLRAPMSESMDMLNVKG